MQGDTSSSDVSASHVGRVRRRKHPTEVSNFFFLLLIIIALWFKLEQQPVSGALFS